jgi:hypothetical protein
MKYKGYKKRMPTTTSKRRPPPVTATEITIVKITNPLYLGQLGPRIAEFEKKLSVKGITYESLYTYFAHNIQFGGDLAEFWVVFEGDTPVGFANWLVRGLPHIATVYCDFITVWTKNPDAHKLLLGQYVKFGEQHRAVWYEGDAVNELVFRLFRKRSKEFNVELNPSGIVNFIGRKASENL